MPTLPELEDVQGALETGFAAGVNATLIMMPFLLSGEFQRPTPRTEIIVTIGNATGARRGFAADVITRFVRWNFMFTILVITLPAQSVTRNEGESDDDFQARVNGNFQLHEDMVSKLRAYASTAAQNSWADLVNFPNHFIAEAIRETNSNKRIKTTEGNHQTALNFSGVVGIRETAWQQLTN